MASSQHPKRNTPISHAVTAGSGGATASASGPISSRNDDTPTDDLHGIGDWIRSSDPIAQRPLKSSDIQKKSLPIPKPSFRKNRSVNQEHDDTEKILRRAVLEGDWEHLVEILQNGADPNLQIHSSGCGSLLALAAFRGMTQFVETLIDVGADVNLKIKRGRYGNALTAACCSNSVDRGAILNILIDSNANVHEQLVSGDFGSPLSAACQMGVIDAISILLQHGANPSALLKHGSFSNALLVAIHSENPAVIFKLLEAGAVLGQVSKHLLALKISKSPAFKLEMMDHDGYQELFDHLEGDPEQLLRRTYNFSTLHVLDLPPDEIRTKLLDVTLFTKDTDTVRLCTLSSIIGDWHASCGLSVLEAFEKALKSRLRCYVDEHLCIEIMGQKLNFMCAHSEPRLKDIFDWIYYAISNAAISNVVSGASERDKIKVLLSPKAVDINLINLETDSWIDFPVFNSSGNNGYCWTSLFDANFVIPMSLRLNDESQISFPVTSRGLLLDFTTMAQLAAVEYPVPVNDGLILLGYSTALVPIRETDDGMIIWHLEIGNEDFQLKTSDLLSTKFEWLQTRDLTYLQSKMALLGWCENSKVLLGSNRLPPSVTWSIAKQKPNTWHWKGANIQTVMQSSAPLQIGGQIGGSFDRVSNMVRFRQSTNYIRCLEGSSRQPIVLYDVSAKRAWLVPLLSVFHHMLFVYCHYVGEDATEEIPPPAEATIQGIHDSLFTLRNKGGKIIQKAGEDSLTVRELIMKFSSNMSQVSLHKPRGSEIFGYEFMDIVTEPTTATLRKARIEKEGLTWISILNEVNCLFCSNLGEAIVGSRSVELFSPCNSLPTGSDFLAASMQCVQNLSERYGGREKDQYHKLSNAHFWQFSVTALEACRHNNQDAVNCWENPDFLQRIRNSRPSPEQDSECLSGYRNAAVVFGSPIKAESNRRTSILKNMYRLSIDPAQEKVPGQRAKIRNSPVRSG